MLPIIEQHRDQIADLCRRFGVKSLELFGSATNGEFNPAKSDIDFFVEYLSYDDPAIADNWFGLQEELEALLGYKVDFTSARTAKNPYFLAMANPQRVTLYAA